MIDPADLMQLAIDKAREGIAQGQAPFGCAIARNDTVLAVAHNTVYAATDITAHAEINAIRQACQKTGRVLLDGCVVAATCEPCPMCAAALHWARATTVYYGATIADARAAGFNELRVAAATVLSRGGSPLQLVPGVLGTQCRELFELWRRSPGARPY